jgi:hypothetical protein
MAPESQSNNPGHHPCPEMPGTILRIYFPPGTEINLLNLLEVSSPGGICIIVRVPLLAGASDLSLSLNSILDSIKKAGGRVEVVNE